VKQFTFAGPGSDYLSAFPFFGTQRCHRPIKRAYRFRHPSIEPHREAIVRRAKLSARLPHQPCCFPSADCRNMTTVLSITMTAERQRHCDRTRLFAKRQDAALCARINVTAGALGAIYGYRAREHWLLLAP